MFSYNINKMPNFRNGKITSSIIFYNRGVPNRARNFGAYAMVNYEILKQLRIYNRRFGYSNIF
jgi:hypothetical protein